jgi:hypothetical protein
MSSGLSFKSILLITTQGVRLWTLERKMWTESKHKLSLESAPSSAAVAVTQGSNVLVLVGDSFTGHLQFIADNKKDALTDEAIGQRLQDDFQIDVSAYEFATQRANLSRNQVQLSVSGIESALYQQILAWVPALMPRKVWLMPVAWFFVPLKSVEPVLLAVASGKDSLMVSHHYLGVDDARELTFDDLTEYVQSRKEERKETHLLYIQAPAKVLKKVESALEDVVAVHPLLGESTEDPMTEAITAVMAKGADTLAELLHFEEDGVVSEEDMAEGVMEAVAAGKAAAGTPEALDASSLPQPKPPVLSAPVPPVSAGKSDRVTIEDEDESEDDHDEDENDFEDVDTDEDEDIHELEGVEVSDEPVSVQETANVQPVSVFDDATEETTEVEPVAAEPDLISRLAAEKSDARATRPVAAASAERYREVAHKRSWGVIIIVFVGMVALTVLVGGAIFWSQQVQPQQQGLIPTEATPTPTPAPTATPTPAPTALTLAQKKQLSTTVQNATTKAGLAGRYQRELNAAGWNVTGAGNADGEYSETGVLIFTTNEAAFATLSSELGGVTVRRLDEKPAGVAASVDVVIILNEAVEPDITPADTAADAEEDAAETEE